MYLRDMNAYGWGNLVKEGVDGINVSVYRFIRR